MRALLLLSLLLWSGAVSASNIRKLEPGAPSPPAQLEDLAWLVGSWEGEGIGGQSYETISAPVAGQMAGHFQQVSGGKVQFYEFYHFVPRDGSILLRIKHFNPDLTGWEEKGETVDFPLVAIEDGAAYFDGLTMLRDGPDGLKTFVVTDANGERGEIGFTFRRAKD